jgi:hypothetical protein
MMNKDRKNVKHLECFQNFTINQLQIYVWCQLSTLFVKYVAFCWVFHCANNQDLRCVAFSWGFHFASNEDLRYRKDLVEINKIFVWNWMQLLQFCWMQVDVKLNTIVWMKLNVGLEVCCKVVWVAKCSILLMQLWWMKLNATSIV